MAPMRFGPYYIIEAMQGEQADRAYKLQVPGAIYCGSAQHYWAPPGNSKQPV